MVPGRSIPAEIGKAVIPGAPVVVATLHAVRPRPNKRSQDEAVHAVPSMLTVTKTHGHMAALARLGFDHTAPPQTAIRQDAVKAPNASAVGNLEQAFVAGNIAPVLHDLPLRPSEIC